MAKGWGEQRIRNFASHLAMQVVRQGDALILRNRNDKRALGKFRSFAAVYRALCAHLDYCAGNDKLWSERRRGWTALGGQQPAVQSNPARRAQNPVPRGKRTRTPVLSSGNI